VHQRAGDFAVLSADDAVCGSYADGAVSSPLWFSATHAVEPGAWLRDGDILLEGEPLMGVAEVP
jgi:hypothetical protein